MIRVKIGEEIKEAQVSEEDYENVSLHKWRSIKRYKKNGEVEFSYPMTTIKTKVVSLHQFIMGKVPDDKDVIDHINGDKFDNRRCNLRFFTFQENAINTKKNSKEEGKYMGVTWWKERKVFKCSHGTKYLGTYETEIEAACRYDVYLMVLGVCSDLYNFKYSLEEKLELLELYSQECKDKEKKEDEKTLPVGITIFNNKYKLQIQRNGKKYRKTDENLGVIIKYREQILEEIENENQKIMEQKKKEKVNVNKDNITYMTFKKSDESEFYVYIDSNKVDQIMDHKWSLDSHNYPTTTINNKSIRMHRWLWETYNEKKIDEKICIDHKNKKDLDKNVLDNRMENLREASYCLNNHNKKVTNKHGYKGVYEVPNRPGWYSAQINMEGNRKYAKNYRTIEEAALAYNLLAIEVFGENAELNKIPEGVKLEEKQRKSKYKYIQNTKNNTWRVKIEKFHVNKTLKNENEALLFRNSTFLEHGENIPED